MLLALPTDILRLIITRPRICTGLLMCSHAAAAIVAPMITWTINGVIHPSRGPQTVRRGFECVAADVCGHIYSITRAGGHIMVEFDGRSAHTVESSGPGSAPTELAVHFPVVGDVTLAESIHEILGGDRYLNDDTAHIKRLYDITLPQMGAINGDRYQFQKNPPGVFRNITGTFVAANDPIKYTLVVYCDIIVVQINSITIPFKPITDRTVSWHRPYVVEGWTLYPGGSGSVGYSGEKWPTDIAVKILCSYFHVRTSDDN